MRLTPVINEQMTSECPLYNSQSSDPRFFTRNILEANRRVTIETMITAHMLLHTVVLYEMLAGLTRLLVRPYGAGLAGVLCQSSVKAPCITLDVDMGVKAVVAMITPREDCFEKGCFLLKMLREGRLSSDPGDRGLRSGGLNSSCLESSAFSSSLLLLLSVSFDGEQ